MKGLFRVMTRRAAQAVLLAVALQQPACKSLNSKEEKKTTLPGRGGEASAPQTDTETDPNTDDAVTSERDQADRVSSPIEPGTIMVALLAPCGSPMADIGDGTFNMAVPGVTYSFTKSGESVTSSDGKEWIVKRTNIESQIEVSGPSAAELPPHVCGRMQSDIVEGTADHIRKYLTVRVGPYSSNVFWFARPAGETPVVYRVSVVVDLQTVDMVLAE